MLAPEDLEDREIFIDDACGKAKPEPDHGDLLKNIAKVFPGLNFHHTLTRTGWHRIGGLITSDLERVDTNLRRWAETESDHDMFELYDKHGASDLLTTRFDGRTHYFATPVGERAPDFIQLEVEELIEIVDRPLFIEDQIPDDIEELLDPPRTSASNPDGRELSRPKYVFKAITDIADLVADHVTSEGSDLRYIRFLEEWDRSSAGGAARFCDHFALRLLPFRDRFGERKIEATALPVNEFAEPDPEAARQSGTALANFLQTYDKAAGFPMAWYFAMLINKKDMVSIAQAVAIDYQRNYRYLPERDVEILNGWINNSYSF